MYPKILGKVLNRDYREKGTLSRKSDLIPKKSPHHEKSSFSPPVRIAMAGEEMLVELRENTGINRDTPCGYSGHNASLGMAVAW